MRSRVVLCGGATDPQPPTDPAALREICLNSAGATPNVHLRLEDVAKALCADLRPRLVDLLEIAAYVFTADCATGRGQGWLDEGTTEQWGRNLRFVIPVRDADFWRASATREILGGLLNFLSDDLYDFEFVPAQAPADASSYLNYGSSPAWPCSGVDRVLMFSGGLDSLAGALENVTRGDDVVLVSHRPVALQSQRQRDLVQLLRQRAARAVLHVPVWVNKVSELGREHTQRTRSFLFCALGVAVAASLGSHGVTFFENGVVSMNWPVADEVLRARASRTTHPVSLAAMRLLCESVLERTFVVENPYVLKTKREVVESIAGLGGHDLIARTCSCAHTGIFQGKTQAHCGTCSQCIDRRVAIVAAGLEEFDPDTDYKVDAFTGPRADGYEKNMAVNFVRHAVELKITSKEVLAERFSLELARALRDVPNVAQAADQLIDLHKRHGETVHAVIASELRRRSADLVAGALETSSLLALAAGQAHHKSTRRSFAERVATVLRTGIPRLYQSKKPENELRLQEGCDGLLAAADINLTREFPFCRWGSVSTKPDFSDDPQLMWVELKYVRQRRDVGEVSRAVATDLTTYGDAGRWTLFVVYDPDHHLVEEASLREAVSSHGMELHVIR